MDEIDKPLTDAELARLADVLDSPPDGSDPSDRVFSLGMLDGFLTSLVLAPNVIPPSQWLHELWGGEMPEFATQGEAEEIIGLIIRQMNQISHELHEAPEDYVPRLDIVVEDDGRETLFGETWCTGFLNGMALDEQAWLAWQERIGEPLSAIVYLGHHLSEDADNGEPAIPEADREMLIDSLPLAVRTIHQRLRPARRGARAEPAHSGAKVGRNDPCPCGSGKKYKKCCRGQGTD